MKNKIVKICIMLVILIMIASCSGMSSNETSEDLTPSNNKKNEESLQQNSTETEYASEVSEIEQSETEDESSYEEKTDSTFPGSTITPKPTRLPSPTFIPSPTLAPSPTLTTMPKESEPSSIWLEGPDNNPRMPDKSYGQRLGITHTSGKYHLTDEPYLIEGAKAALEMGVKNIKVWLETTYQSRDYIFNHNWKYYGTAKGLAASDYYKELFDMPFDTFILLCHSFRGGNIHNQSAPDAYEKEIYELSKYLLETYRGTGKTFIIQNWEGDWLCAGTTDRNNTAAFNDSNRHANFTNWLNAMQRGINRARGNVTNLKRNDVYVFGMAEVNLLDYDTTKHSLIADTVIPNLEMDLYSYSNWQTMENKTQLRNYVGYLKDRANPSKAFGEDNIVLGEFGWPESAVGEARQRNIVNAQADVMINEFNSPYVIYWQLYCNEFKGGIAVNNPTNNDMSGFWAIRSDGSTNAVYDWFVEKLK